MYVLKDYQKQTSAKRRRYWAFLNDTGCTVEKYFLIRPYQQLFILLSVNRLKIAEPINSSHTELKYASSSVSVISYDNSFYNFDDLRNNEP